MNKTSPEPTSPPWCSANRAVTKGHQRGYTLVSSPSKRPILSTFLSIVAWQVISLAHSIGNQPLSPSRSLSPSYQPAKKNRILMKHLDESWPRSAPGRILGTTDNERWGERWNRGQGFKGEWVTYQRQNMIRGPEVRQPRECMSLAELWKEEPLEMRTRSLGELRREALHGSFWITNHVTASLFKNM